MRITVLSIVKVMIKRKERKGKARRGRRESNPLRLQRQTFASFAFKSSINVNTRLENYLQLREKRKERFAGIDDGIVWRAEVRHVGRTVARLVCKDVFKAPACLEHRSSEGESDV